MKVITCVDTIIKNYSDKVLVIGFYSGFCQEFEALTKVYEDINFVQATEATPKLFDFFEIENIPTIVVIDNLKEKFRVKDMNIDLLKNYFKSQNNVEANVTKVSDTGLKYTVIDFYAEWCGPCKTIAPKFEELSKKFTNVSFKKVNVDEYQEISSEFNIKLLPTFIVLKNDVEVLRVTGTDLSQIEDLLGQN